LHPLGAGVQIDCNLPLFICTIKTKQKQPDPAGGKTGTLSPASSGQTSHYEKCKVMRFNDTRTTRLLGSEPVMSGRNLMKTDIPGSDDVAGIELRLLPPFIVNNRTPRLLLLPGFARLYCLTMVISDAENQLKGFMDLAGFAGIGDGEALPVNKTIFYWEKEHAESQPPNQVHVMTSIIKSKESLRETGEILSSVRGDNDYKDLIDGLGSAVADAANFSLVANISLQVAGIIGKYLGKVDDRPIGTVVNSFTRLHGDWDKLGINPILIRTRNVDFNYELIIRDRERMSAEQPGALSLAAVQKTSFRMTPM